MALIKEIEKTNHHIRHQFAPHHTGEPILQVTDLTVQYDGHLALDHISFALPRAIRLAVLGPNGAGKSTLLKVVARVLRPTRGRVRVRGRVAPLLELGAGFDPEMTGRENIFLNGTLLGFSAADIQQRLDRIVEFAGIREFLDAPLRTYSTGMAARLGFAVATDVQPEILIVDEVLAVGDEEFQRKSAARMQTLREHGEAILMVSHTLETVKRMCHRVAWLDHGELRAVGPPAEVVAEYQKASA